MGLIGHEHCVGCGKVLSSDKCIWCGYEKPKTNLEKAWDVLGNLPARSADRNLPRFEIRLVDNQRQHGMSSYLLPDQMQEMLQDNQRAGALLHAMWDGVMAGVLDEPRDTDLSIIKPADERRKEIMVILQQMQSDCLPGNAVVAVRKVKSYIAHLLGRLSELESPSGAKIECRRADINQTTGESDDTEDADTL